MKEIKRHIKERCFSKVYLLTGDEEYLISQARKMLKNALSPEEDTMNYHLYEETKIDLLKLAEDANTYPFFQEKRLIILDRTGILKSGKDELVKIFEQMPETTCILICEPEADKRSKGYKWIKKNGYIGEFLKKDQTEKMLLRFIASLLSREKIQIRESDARLLLQRAGNEMYQIKYEVEKLISYMGEEKIVTGEMIREVVACEAENKIFDLVAAIAEGQKKKALSYYDDLLVLREPFMHILYLITRQYRILSVIYDMKKERKPDAQIASVAGLPRFAIRKYDGQLRNYTARRLSQALKLCVAAEQNIKEGKISDQLALETLVIELMN